MGKCMRWPWLFGLGLALVVQAAGAQILPGLAPAPESPAAATAVEAIPAADIPGRADAAERFSQDVLSEADGSDPTAAFEPRLQALEASVRDQAGMFKDKELRLLPVTRLESIERHWRFFRRQSEAWRDDLKQASEQSLADAAEIAQRKAVWSATLTAAQSDALPAAIIDRVRAVQADLAKAERAIAAPINRQIRLSRRANALDARIQAGQKAVAAAIAYNDSRLGKIDAPALWNINLASAGGTRGESVRDGLAAEAQFVKDYNDANHLASRVQNVLTLALLPLLLWLSRRSRKQTYTDPQVQASMLVLQRPFAAWLLLVATSVLVIEPEAPIIVHQIALFLALVPVLRLLPPRTFEILGPWPYVATGLYLLNLLGFIFLGNATVHRLYLLGLTLLALLLLLWLLWRSRAAANHAQLTHSNSSTVTTIIRDAGWIAIAILVVSALANVVGNVSLAEMLTNALLFTGYVGLVLYAGVTVMSSILRLALTRGRIARLPMVAQYSGPLLRGLTWVLRVGAALGWLAVLLNQFRILRPLYHAAKAVLTFPFGVGQISLTLGNVLAFVFSVFLAFWVAKTTRLVLRDDVLPNMALPRGVANSVSSLSYYALLLVGLLVALAAAGFQVSQLTLVLGALGVGIGLGLQNVVNNFVSGLILMFERPIQPGDVVEITGTAGTVRDIGMRATTLTTFDGADVVVPNGTLLSEKLINWTLSNLNRRMEVSVGVAYGSDAKAVLDLLIKVTSETEGVATEPEPTVFFSGFGASSLDFKVRAWTNHYGDWVKTHSDLSVNIYQALNEAGIEIPFPQTDLHVRSVAPDLRGILGKAPAKPDEDTMV